MAEFKLYIVISFRLALLAETWVQYTGCVKASVEILNVRPSAARRERHNLRTTRCNFPMYPVG